MRSAADADAERPPARARRWLGERLGMLDYWRRPDWRDGWGGPFNGQACRQRLLAELFERVPFAAIVETGTYRGTTTGYLRRTTRLPIHSFEINPRHYGFARVQLLSAADVHLHYGDSRAGLLHLASSNALPPGCVFFYLDAHGPGDDLPLADEVALALRHWPQAVAMVDDFAVPDDPGYGFDDYGSGQALSLAYLRAHGVLPTGVWFPRCTSSEETGARRGCVVLAGAPELAPRIDSVTTLRRWPSPVEQPA